jgi:hypothetical protein
MSSVWFIYVVGEVISPAESHVVREIVFFFRQRQAVVVLPTLDRLT